MALSCQDLEAALAQGPAQPFPTFRFLRNHGKDTDNFPSKQQQLPRTQSCTSKPEIHKSRVCRFLHFGHLEHQTTPAPAQGLLHRAFHGHTGDNPVLPLQKPSSSQIQQWEGGCEHPAVPWITLGGHRSNQAISLPGLQMPNQHCHVGFGAGAQDKSSEMIS